MAIDLEKIRPAPWHAEYFDLHDVWDLTYGPENDGSERFSVIEDSDEAKQAEALKFAALARNAFAGDPEALAWWEANRVKTKE